MDYNYEDKTAHRSVIRPQWLERRRIDFLSLNGPGGLIRSKNGREHLSEDQDTCILQKTTRFRLCDFRISPIWLLFVSTFLLGQRCALANRSQTHSYP